MGKLQHQRRIQRHSGFTLVELLVVIAIIGILIALLLPAIQAAREAARQTVCTNHLKQLSLAALNHQDAQKTLPAGGWGYLWVGDPDRGFGRMQPGGWIYNILPFLEEKNLHDLGKGAAPQSAAKKTAAALMIQTPLEAFNCPTRRPVQLFETGTGYTHFRTPNYTDTVMTVARADYVGNGGSVNNDPSPPSGPTSYSDFTTNWDAKYNTMNVASNGIFCAGNAMKFNKISDGTSHTYLLGEKKMVPANYFNGVSNNDNENMYMGANGDVHAWANTTTQYQAEADLAGNGDSGQFGSAHVATFNVAFCDGSTHRIPFDIDPKTHQALANRKDGVQINTKEFE